MSSRGFIPAVVAAVLAFCPSIASAETPSHLEEAGKSYRAAQVAYAAGNYQVAFDELGVAYRATRVPELLFNRALCAERLRRWQLAIDFFNRYLAEGEVDDSAAIRERVALLAEAARAPQADRPALAELPFRGAVYIDSSPSGAVVSIGEKGGKRSGVTPFSMAIVGKHRFFAEKEGYAPSNRLVVSTAGELTFLWFELEEQEAATATAEPPTEPAPASDVDGGMLTVGGAGIEGAKVLLDGELLCERGPCRRPVAEGSHSISFRREGYKPYQRTVVIQAGTETTLTVQLIPEAGRADAVTAYVVAGAFLGVALYSSLEVSSLRDELDRQVAEGNPPLQSDDDRLGWGAFTGGKFWATTANAAYGVSGAALMLAVYYTFRDKGPPSSGESTVTSLSARPAIAPEFSGVALGGQF